MHDRLRKPPVLVALWTAIFASGLLIPLGLRYLPAAMLVGLGEWWILRMRVPIGHAAAVAFGVSLPVGQLPPYLLYFTAYSMGFGGLDGPPEWFVPVTLASGGLVAGLIQFLGLPKSGRNLALWVPATVLAWIVSWLGDVPIRGMVVLSAVLSGLVTAWAMLRLSAAASIHDHARAPTGVAAPRMRERRGRAVGRSK